MKYVGLGQSSLKVSRIALGMMTFGTSEWRPWVLGEEGARPIVQRAVELGINMFDTADMYSAGVSEQITGKLLRDLARRDEIVIATSIIRSTSSSKAATRVHRSRPSGRT
jgi:1-deoxyxylulose-5-phosphate synthase